MRSRQVRQRRRVRATIGVRQCCTKPCHSRRGGSLMVKEPRKQIFIHVYWGAELVKLLLRDTCANVARRTS